MPPRILLLALALAATGSFAASPAQLPGPAFPHYVSPAELTAACNKNIGTVQAAVRRLERQRPGPHWLAAYDDINVLTEDLSGPIFLLTNVHPDKAMREASEACELLWQDFSSTLGQNETLYRAATQVKPRDDIDREFKKLTLEQFEDAGVSLQPGPRARAKALQDRITALGQAFEKNIRDANVQVPFTVDELKGVPESVWKDAPRDAQGHVLLGLDEPVYVPVLQGAVDPAARERIWRAKTNEGGQANLKLLAELAQLRREYALLFGVASHAEFLLRRRMAGTPGNVTKFLDDVGRAVAVREQRELDELRDAKARDLGVPVSEVAFQRWDTAYYTERVRRERYRVDQEAFRTYLPPQESLALVMRVIEKMLGIKYTRVPGVRLWHPDVQAYAVSDAATGKPLAALYVDLYPRPGKYNSAAVWSYRNASTRLHRVPQAALIVNFDRHGLTLDDLSSTLLHEFGHSVHSNLSTTRYSSQGGTNTLLDFVEAPSQMLEKWVYDARVLAVMREACPSCKPIPDDLLDQARAADRYGRGMLYARQRLYAAFDLALYDAEALDPMALWARMEGATPLGHVPGTMFPAGFSHSATGYSAGYYGYLWSEVVAADLRTAFAADKLDPEVGRRYRNTVLANGGQRPPAVLVREFLGRETNANAFFEDLKR